MAVRKKKTAAAAETEAAAPAKTRARKVKTAAPAAEEKPVAAASGRGRKPAPPAFDPTAEVAVTGEQPTRGKAGAVAAAFLQAQGRKRTTAGMLAEHIATEFDCSSASAYRKLGRLVDNGYLNIG